jgi:hypothetical protein
MPVTKTILKCTNNETVVKVAGTAAAATIDLQTDCVATTDEVSGATQTVNIAQLQYTGLASSTITVTRNSVNIFTIGAEGEGTVDLGTGNGIADTIQNTQDIVVTIAGAEAQCYLVLRKVGGFASKVENSTYGAYDDPTRVGASTTMSGSPDKV